MKARAPNSPVIIGCCLCVVSVCLYVSVCLCVKARAPNSPVIIVGTHCDVVQKTHPAGWVEQLGLMVERRYMPGSEPDKFGLPRVVGHVEVCCRGRIIGRSLRYLADFIFSVAIDERLPGILSVCLTHMISQCAIYRM